MKSILTYIIYFIPYIVLAQFTGSYTGAANGDPVVLVLQQNANNEVTGTMKDSHQNYIVDGKITSNSLVAKATEVSMGLIIYLTGNLSGNNLQLKGDLDLLGVKTLAFNTTLIKGNLSTTTSTQKTNLPAKLNGKTIDPNIIGLWRQESHYNSGYGSNFSGSTYTYSSFNRDHTMSENGSKAAVSGTNYSGQAGGQSQANVIPNIWYYTEGNTIMAVLLNNGIYTTEKLGTYYIENGKMLFTQANTMKKILYYKE